MSKGLNDRILVISDLHAPFFHPDTVAFLAALKKKYAPTRVISVGDECFPGDAEVLTPDGWVQFQNLQQGVPVAQWHEDGSLDFVVPYAYTDRPNTQDLLRIEHNTYLSLTTPRHRIVKIHPRKGTAHTREAWDREGTDSWFIPRHGMLSGPGSKESDAQLRLRIAFQADGTWDRAAVKFNFNKARKVIRLKKILDECGIEYVERLDGRDTTVIYIARHRLTERDVSKTLPTEWLATLDTRQRALVLDELVHWDGTPIPKGVRYTSQVPENRDLIQALAATSGRYVGCVSSTYVDVHTDRTEQTSQKSAKFTYVPGPKRVYCVSVPSSMILVRQEGHVVVSGNCDKHALSFHDSDPDLPSAGDELKYAIKSLQPLYRMFPDMDIVDSNHGSLIYRKAHAHGIPRKYIVPYGEVLNAPKGWKWSIDLILPIPGGNQLYVHHGLSKDVGKVVAQRGLCVVSGHYHTEFRITYLGNPNHLLWGMNVGCLIDPESIAFAYGRNNLGRPIIGCGVVLDGLPKLAPMVLTKKGRWNGVCP